MWQERAAAAATASSAPLAPCALFFGCRNATEDWLFRDEMLGVGASAAVLDSALTHVEVAFSRPRGAPPSSSAAEADADAALDALLHGSGGGGGGVPAAAAAAGLAAVSTRGALPGSSEQRTRATFAAAAASAAGTAPAGGGCYVQYLIAEAALARTLASWILERGAFVFISGSARRMPSDVIAALRDALVEHGGLDAPAAQTYVAAMERSRRLVFEAWS